MKPSMDCRPVLAAVLLLVAGPSVAAAPDAGSGAPVPFGADPSHPVFREGRVPLHALTDAQSAGILLAWSEIAREQGRVASQKAHAAAVKQYARDVSDDGAGLEKSVKALVAKLGLQAAESATSQELRAEGAKGTRQLARAQGEDFDRVYLASAVKVYDRLQDILEDSVMPSVKSPELEGAVLQTHRTLLERRNFGEGLQRRLAARTLDAPVGVAPAGAPAGAAAAPDAGTADAGASSQGARHRTARVQLTDAQSAGVLLTASDIALEAGRTAASKAHEAEVKEYARLLVRDHEQLRGAVRAVVEKRGMKPADSEPTAKLQREARRSKALMAQAKGAEFDRVYLVAMVTLHDRLQIFLEDMVLPSLQDAELLQVATKAHPELLARRNQGERLQLARVRAVLEREEAARNPPAAKSGDR